MPSVIHCIAIDDEPLALSVIKAHARQVPFLDLSTTFSSATEALTYIKENEPGLIFLDINMPDISGLDFARLVPPGTKIVFTTAYPEHAVDGFELAATDYLLKPIGYARFLQACSRVQELMNGTVEKDDASSTHIFVKDGYSMVRVNFDDLMYVQAADNYIAFVEQDKKTLTRMTMAEAIEKLP